MTLERELIDRFAQLYEELGGAGTLPVAADAAAAKRLYLVAAFRAVDSPLLKAAGRAQTPPGIVIQT